MKITIPIDRENREPHLVFRGGYWNNNPYSLPASDRDSNSLANRNRYIGFRIVRNHK